MPKIIDHNQYRQKLLSDCFRLFADQGYGSLTMRQIASELGVSTGTLYHYFESKEDLYNQLVERIAAESIRQSENTVEKRPTLEERLDSFLEFFKSFEGLLMQNLLIMTDYNRAEKANGGGSAGRYPIDVLTHVEWTANYLEVDDLELVRFFLFFLQGLAWQRYMDGGKTKLDRQLAMIKTMFLSSYRESKN